ncbi:MAG TPA: hypothetical protein VGS57_13130 [Thermoanaerobaculia bacterium]|jgi:hypothetical protein|nr:hypothetical protein [Thermoanaerobaculia bacterium]
MKKLSAFALLLLAFAAASVTAAHAAAIAGTHVPLFRQPYLCDYSPGPWTTERDPGITAFGSEQWFDTNGDGLLDLVFANEGFESTTVGFDNRRIAFAKPVDFCGLRDPGCLNPDSPVVRTDWEYTINNSIQCKHTSVSDYGRRIIFSGCSNGKTRVCNLY